MNRYYYEKPLDFIKSGFAEINTKVRKLLARQKGQGKSFIEVKQILSNIPIWFKIIAIVVLAILIPMGISTYFSGKTVGNQSSWH